MRLARDFTRWTQNVKSMVASNAKWQLVTTFNEWGEGTDRGTGSRMDQCLRIWSIPGCSSLQRKYAWWSTNCNRCSHINESTNSNSNHWADYSSNHRTDYNSATAPPEQPTGTVLPTNVPTAGPTIVPTSTATPSSVGTTNTLLLGR